MPIVTLTSDFGTQDHYVGGLKGSIKRFCPEAELIDISNSVPAFNLPAAAYTFAAAFRTFPEGSIHILLADLFSRNENRILLCRVGGHWILAPDNGILSLVFQELPRQLYALEPLLFFKLDSFADQLGETIARIAAGDPVEAIGTEVHNVAAFTQLRPQVDEQMIRGSLIYIDAFHNAVFNITSDLYEQYMKGRNFEISFARYRLNAVSRHYKDVPEGELVCFFNTAGYLELAINQGRAASLLGLKTGDFILIEIR